MSKKKKIIGGICVVVAAAVVGVSVLNSKNNAALMPVSTETLQRMNLQNTVSLTGTVESETGRKVYSTLTYPVESVNVAVGDVVQEGDVLAKLKTSDLELDIAQQQAAVNASKNQAAHQIEVSRKAYENAKENYENDLNANALSAEQGVTQAENAVKQAKQQLDSAKAAVRNAKENYRLTRDQLEDNVTDAERALEDAEEALGDAKDAYNDAVAGQAGAEAEAQKVLEQEEAKFNEAKAEWDSFQEIHRQDYDDAKGNLDKAQEDFKKKEEAYKNSITPENPDGDSNLKTEMENAKGARDDAEKTFIEEKEKRAPAKAAYDLAEASWNMAQKSYQETLSAIASSASGAMSGVASAQSGVSAAEAQLDAAKDARNGANMAQMEQGIDTAERGVDSAELSKDIAKQSKESAEQQEAAAKNAIEQQIDSLQDSLVGSQIAAQSSQAQEIAIQKQSKESAEQQEAAAKNAIEQQIDSLQDSLVGSQIAAQSSQAQEIAIQKMQNTLQDATVTAPVSGVVTAVYAKVGEPGNGLLFVIEDTQSLKIKTHIKEYDIANVKVGMPVTIKSDATGEKEISGTVTYIAPAAVKNEAGTGATAPTSSSGSSVVEFEAEVQVNEKDSGLRIGMNTRLTVLLEERENVFGVPYDSVVEKADGTQVVYAVEKQSDGKKDGYIVQEVPVTTGLETDFYVEVSGQSIENGMSIVSDPQSVVPGMEVNPDFAAAGGEPVVGMSQQEQQQSGATTMVAAA